MSKKYVWYWSQLSAATTGRTHTKDFCQSVQKGCKEKKKRQERIGNCKAFYNTRNLKKNFASVCTENDQLVFSSYLFSFFCSNTGRTTNQISWWNSIKPHKFTSMCVFDKDVIFAVSASEKLVVSIKFTFATFGIKETMQEIFHRDELILSICIFSQLFWYKPRWPENRQETHLKSSSLIKNININFF